MLTVWQQNSKSCKKKIWCVSHFEKCEFCSNYYRVHQFLREILVFSWRPGMGWPPGAYLIINRPLITPSKWPQTPGEPRRVEVDCKCLCARKFWKSGASGWKKVGTYGGTAWPTHLLWHLSRAIATGSDCKVADTDASDSRDWLTHRGQSIWAQVKERRGRSMWRCFDRVCASGFISVELHAFLIRYKIYNRSHLMMEHLNGVPTPPEQ